MGKRSLFCGNSLIIHGNEILMLWARINNYKRSVRRMSAMDKIEELSFYFNLRMNYNDILKSLAVSKELL